MTRAEFAAQLETTKIPVFFDHAPIGTPVPFLTYTWNYDNFGADNKAYKRIAAVTVTHYHSDYTRGDDLKAVFDENDLFWNCDSDYDSDQKLYTDIYTMEVLADG
jgi:L-ascorbate metabolism protein UlaG (beta-lactamase superfamily)